MFDICIIGAGGVVGAAIAREAALQGRSVVALEKHDSACRETSGLNSRVIHSGFHEHPNTLKAELALEGSRLLTQYVEAHGVEHSRTGMLIAIPYGAVSEGLWRDPGALWNLWRRGRSHKVPFRFVLSQSAIHALAPIQAIGGIFIPSVYVINIEQTVASLQKDAEEAGARFLYQSDVVDIGKERDSYRVITLDGKEVRAHTLINSGGLRAHEISVMAGGPSYRVDFLRGDYYELAGGIARWGIRTLVYPAMPPNSPSKGVHFGPRTDGKLYFGPSATLQSEPMSKPLFLAAARRFLPQLQSDDLQWAYAGIRPKHAAGGGKADFVIRLDCTTPPLINLIGIDSPGLSASMAIAERVVGMIP